MYALNLLSIILMFFISVSIWAIIGLLWGTFRSFFHNNYSYFDASFIMAYFLEQLLLIFLLAFSPFDKSFLIGIFALLVVSTASFQKLASESRIREISEASIEQSVIIDDVLGLNEKLIKDNRGLKKTIDKLKDFIKDLLEKQR